MYKIYPSNVVYSPYTFITTKIINMNTWISGRMQQWYLYGISVNPRTNAHHEIIKHISGIGDGDLTVFPSYQHPMKNNLIDFDHQVNMFHLLCDPLERVYVSPLESKVEVFKDAAVRSDNIHYRL